MELKEFLHMNEGDGELSYSQNSSLQKGVSEMSKARLESAIKCIVSEELGRGKCINVADLGCGVGQVPLSLVSMVRENVKNKCGEDEHHMPEIQIYMNDLPSNDFNLLFRDSITKMEKDDVDTNMAMPLCFLMGAPGSYYNRLFPSNTLHLVHANYTLHWLSQAPGGLYREERGGINKGNIYISETSPEEVGNAYLEQFEKDMRKFLECRSEEVTSNGIMLFTFRGRPSSSHLASWQPWELQILANSIAFLVSKGMIEKEKMDSFDFPYFGASKEEIESIVEREGSFAIESMETMAHPVSLEIQDFLQRAEAIAKFMRAFSQPLLSRHFGFEVMDALFDKVALLTLEHLANHRPVDHFTIIVLLRRKM